MYLKFVKLYMNFAYVDMSADTFLSNVNNEIIKIESDFVDTVLKTPFTEVSNFLQNTGGLLNVLGDMMGWLTKYFYIAMYFFKNT